SQKRNDKLKAYAQSKEKTVTQLVEDWIDRLPRLGDRTLSYATSFHKIPVAKKPHFSMRLSKFLIGR
ncbi:MAG: hypothetical protein V7K98_21190, partial [Nostoc sp.]